MTVEEKLGRRGLIAAGTARRCHRHRCSRSGPGAHAIGCRRHARRLERRAGASHSLHALARRRKGTRPRAGRRRRLPRLVDDGLLPRAEAERRRPRDGRCRGRHVGGLGRRRGADAAAGCGGSRASSTSSPTSPSSLPSWCRRCRPIPARSARASSRSTPRMRASRRSAPSAAPRWPRAIPPAPTSISARCTG